MSRILNPATGNMILRTSPLGRRLVKLEQETDFTKPQHKSTHVTTITCYPSNRIERIELQKQIDANKFRESGYDWAPWCLTSVWLTYVLEKVRDCETLLLARDHTTNDIKGFACVETTDKYLMIDLICAQNSGTLIMNTIIEMGKRLKKQFIYLEAVESVIPFYQKMGFLNKLLKESLVSHSCHQQNKLIAKLSQDVANLRKRLASKRSQTIAHNKLITELNKQKLTMEEDSGATLYPMVKCI